MDFLDKDLLAQNAQDIEYVRHAFVKAEVDAIGVGGNGEAGVGDEQNVRMAQGGQRCG